jgi:purine-binding chemotaxis protein CheW
MNELYVVFSVAGTEYALPSSVVRQLETYQGATRVPGTASHVAGIIQIRGQVIPTIDLRRLFGHESVDPTLDTRVVIVEHGARLVALIVDRGREVLRIDSATVQVTPGLVEDKSKGLFGGLVQLGPRLIMLLDLRKVIGEEDLNVEFSRRLEPSSVGAPGLLGSAAPSVADGDERARQKG